MPVKTRIVVCFVMLLGACSTPNFVNDASPVPVTATTPDHFEFPARFALARIVYGTVQAAGAEETAVWTDLADRAESLGSFSALVGHGPRRGHVSYTDLAETAREQRYTYLLVVWMDPATGSADVMLVHVGSSGIMATAQAVSPAGGQRGFWGGRINNVSRLERVTLNIAEATVSVVEDMLRDAAMRQR